MQINYGQIILTISLYAVFFTTLFLTEKFYTPRAANDITGPPFLVGVIGILILLFFLFRSIYMAAFKDSSYWIPVIIHVVMLVFVFFKFMR